MPLVTTEGSRPASPPTPDTTPVAAAVALAHGGAAVIPNQSRAERRSSFDPADFPSPSGREEEWRFTPMDRLRGLATTAELFQGGVEATSSGPDEIQRYDVPQADAVVGSSRLVPEDRASARAWAGADTVTVVRVPKEFEAQTPYTVRHVGLGADRASCGHAVIVAERFSRATVVLEFEGSVTRADNIEVVVEDGAHLTLVSVQGWDADAVHLSRQHARIGRDATLRHIVISLGGDVVRIDATAQYDGPGGRYEGLGVYFADAGQHLEHRLFVDHAVPKCSSDVLYHGALQGDGAHTVWIGDVLIRAEAEGTDTYELNRNLVLTDGARADSVPNLEIETGEIVGAGHASATGRFDDEQLFYLQSRGIPAEEARRLVVHAFFARIVDKIGVPDLAQRIMGAVEIELAGHVHDDAVTQVPVTA